MTKKLLCLILTMVIALPVFTLGVTAAEVTGVLIDETFDASLTLPEGCRFGVDFNESMPAGEKCRVEGSEGNNYVVVERGENDVATGTTSAFLASANNIATDHTILFDIKRCSGTSDIYIRTDGASSSFKVKDDKFNADKWYNICIQVIGRKSTIYYRERTETGNGAWSVLQAEAALAGTVTARIFMHVNEVDSKLLFDNYKLVVGTKVVSAEIDTTTFAAQNKARATIKVSTVDYTPGGSGTVTPILVAFDKKGHILAFEAQVDAPLVFEPNASGDNNTYNIDLDYTSFKEKLNGGTIEVYIWETIDSISPMADPTVQVVNLP